MLVIRAILVILVIIAIIATKNNKIECIKLIDTEQKQKLKQNTNT